LDFTGNIQQVIVNAVYENTGFVSGDVSFFLDDQPAILEGCLLLAQTALAPVHVVTNQRAFAAKCQQAGLKTIVVRPKAGTAWQVEAIRRVIKQQPPFNLLDVGVIYTNAHTAKAIYDAVEKGFPVTTTEVVLVPDDPQQQTIAHVKIGTNVQELFHEVSIPQHQGDVAWFNGNILNGSAMKTDSFVVHQDASTIGVTSRVLDEDICIKCGLCNDACPVGILPQNIMDAEIREAEDRIYDYKVDQCVECGLCSYVCPSEINVLEWVRRAKRRVARGVE